MRHPIPVLAATIFSLAFVSACGDTGASPGSVAQAANFRLSVDEAARMVAPIDELPAEVELLEAVAEFWMDYTLLIWAVNQSGELDRVDFGPLLRQQSNQEMVLRLRDEVIDADTVVTDEEVRQYFEQNRPGEAVRLRHILLLFPENATAVQRDSVRALIREIRDRARAGGSAEFAELAQTYSQDEGTAERGGDLNWIGRGTVVPQFEDAAFALEPGQVSDVVETQYGLHVIRVEERQQPSLDEVAEQVRLQIQTARSAQAESIYVTEIEARTPMTIEPDAFEIVREMARRPQARMTDRAARRPLVRYGDGIYTAGDYREFLLLQAAPMRAQIAEAEDEPLDAMLRNLARSELLVAEAVRLGIEITAEEEAEVAREFREQLRSAAEVLEVSNVTPGSGESLESAVDREAKALLTRLVSGEQDLVPLGNLALPLRIHYRGQVSQSRIQDAVARVQELRAEGYRGDATPPAPAPESSPEEGADPGTDDGNEGL